MPRFASFMLENVRSEDLNHPKLPGLLPPYPYWTMAEVRPVQAERARLPPVDVLPAVAPKSGLLRAGNIEQTQNIHFLSTSVRAGCMKISDDGRVLLHHETVVYGTTIRRGS